MRALATPVQVAAELGDAMAMTKMGIARLRQGRELHQNGTIDSMEPADAASAVRGTVMPACLFNTRRRD